MAMLEGREVSNHRKLSDSDYFIPRDYVHKFANKVALWKAPPVDPDGYNKGDESVIEEAEGGDPTDGEEGSKISDCARSWKAAVSDEKKKMWGMFDESGVFMSACRHGLILWIIDMIKSGEL